jgi:thiol-disulfide isomerase/thioredoxin
MTIAALLFALCVTTSAEESREPVLLDFQASWCGPCRQMRPAIELLVRKNYPVKEVDIDENPDLAKRYQVESVPTFIVVDSQGKTLARTEGYQPAADLARLYLDAKAKLARSAVRQTEELVDDRGQADDDANQAPEDEPLEDDRPAPAKANPDPWKSVVRIKIDGNGVIGFGSGTIIYSTAEQSIILTCAHIFKIEGRQSQPHPSQFNRRIRVDLFDGQLHSMKPAQVHQVDSVDGEAIDYDFGRDVGLIRIRPGRRLPASRVVPPTWAPRAGMEMTTVGCSEGHDATAWSTKILRPLTRLQLAGSPGYEAIECRFAPKQGRSGGGLYTIDGYVAGVCDFAEPRGNVGLYATPRSIHHILDRNRLTALYLPPRREGDTLLAGNRTRPTRSATAPSIARAQSPESDESNRVTIPPPELLGIRPPVVAQNPPARKASSRNSWHSAQATELALPPEADNDRFDPLPQREEQVVEAPVEQAPRVTRRPVRNGGWKAVREASPRMSAADR